MEQAAAMCGVLFSQVCACHIPQCAAIKVLAAEPENARTTKIPVVRVPRGEPLVNLYRKMVDENLVRRDTSFREMALLSLPYARGEGIESGDAVTILYASTLKQKLTYIQHFAVFWINST
jgi:ParB family chromosome partitioning protein